MFLRGALDPDGDRALLVSAAASWFYRFARLVKASAAGAMRCRRLGGSRGRRLGKVIPDKRERIPRHWARFGKMSPRAFYWMIVGAAGKALSRFLGSLGAYLSDIPRHGASLPMQSFETSG